MKNRNILVLACLILLPSLGIYADTNIAPVTSESTNVLDENLRQAQRLYQEKYYEQAVEYLRKFITEHPDDPQGIRFLEQMYDKVQAFQLEYLQGKNYYNDGMYRKALDSFEKALKIGNSEKLQFHLADTRKKIFQLETAFVQGAIREEKDGFVLEWARDKALTNATVYLVKSDNLQLMNAIAYFNKNRIIIPDLDSFFKGKIYRRIETGETKVSIPANYFQDNYLIVLYPHTLDGIRSQPLIRLITHKSDIRHTVLLLESPKKVEPVAPATNYVEITPGTISPVIVSRIVQEESLDDSSNNTMADLAVQQETESRNLTNEQKDKQEVIRTFSQGWLWLLILLLLLLYVYYRYRRKRELLKYAEAQAMHDSQRENWKTVHALKKEYCASEGEVPAILKTKRSRRGVGKTLIILTVIAFIVGAAGENTFLYRYFDKGTAEYYDRIISEERDYQPTPYDSVVKYYAYEPGIEMRDYKATMDFVRATSEGLKQVAETYYDAHDYQNYALFSFMVYYIGKNFSYFASSVNVLREKNREKISQKLLEESGTMEGEEKYLAALIRYTGYISLASALPSEAIPHMNELYTRHRDEYSQVESEYAVRRLNSLIRRDGFTPSQKTAFALMETESYLSNFAPDKRLSEMKDILVDYGSQNYRTYLYNNLLAQGHSAYTSRKYKTAARCYELALDLLPESAESMTLVSNLLMSRDAVTGQGLVVTVTNRR